MKCFYYFKDKTRGREPKSAPVFPNQSNVSNLSKSNASTDERVTKSFGSTASTQSSTERVIRSSGSATSTRTIPELYEERAHNLRVFSFSELRQATNDFSKLLKIGEGGFGFVYKAAIKPVDGRGDRIVVAIKKLNGDGHQGHKQWVAEVQFLGVVEHPNLVKLIGYCAVDGEKGIQRLLVYEFMPNRSLGDHLFNKAYRALSWEKRLHVVLGAAQGLAYLHEELEVQVIYRDFKSTNVLLDKDFNPKLSDFGLAREGPTEGNTHVSTAVMGTHGYAAPDYIETGHLTSKSDVWSFGVVLYEVLTGRLSFERNRPKSEQKLLDWVKHFPADSRKFGIIMDPRLENQYSLTAAREVAKLANSCLVKSSKDRPTMSRVVESLKRIIEISDQGSPSHEIIESSDHEAVETNKVQKDTGASESAKRRMTHLAKLSEHVGGFSRKGLMLMQRTKDP